MLLTRSHTSPPEWSNAASGLSPPRGSTGNRFIVARCPTTSASSKPNRLSVSYVPSGRPIPSLHPRARLDSLHLLGDNVRSPYLYQVSRVPAARRPLALTDSLRHRLPPPSPVGERHLP